MAVRRARLIRALGGYVFRMVIEIHLDYFSGVTCFDPEKVMLRLLDAFPEASTDWQDHAAAELQRVIAFVHDKHNEVPPEHGEQMVASIRRKTWQNGPAFLFHLGGGPDARVKGWVRRYQVGFESGEKIVEDLRLRVVRFLEGLGLGEVTCR